MGTFIIMVSQILKLIILKLIRPKKYLFPSEHWGEFFLSRHGCSQDCQLLKKYQENKTFDGKAFTLTYEALKNRTWLFDCKTVLELCSKVSQPSIVEIVSKK